MVGFKKMGFLCAGLVLAGFAGYAVIAAPLAQSAVCRIMPVGDSITEGGSTFSNWRLQLLEKLVAAGYRVQYVGTKTSPSPRGPLAHEGYGGKNAEFLARTVAANFKKCPADIVLLHCGHNHDAVETPVAGIVAANEAMIASFRAVNPKVTVLLAQVIPSGKLPKYSYIPELNRKLAEMAQRISKPSQPVIVVNQAEGFDPAMDTVADKVHPNARGAGKMAARWFEALSEVIGPTGLEGLSIKDKSNDR